MTVLHSRAGILMPNINSNKCNIRRIDELSLAWWRPHSPSEKPTAKKKWFFLYIYKWDLPSLIFSWEVVKTQRTRQKSWKLKVLLYLHDGVGQATFTHSESAYLTTPLDSLSTNSTDPAGGQEICVLPVCFRRWTTTTNTTSVAAFPSATGSIKPDQ